MTPAQLAEAVAGARVPVDLTPEQAAAILEGLKPDQVRQVRNRYGSMEVHIYWRLWWHLCRTDLMDDVCTFGESRLEDYLAKLRHCYGARLGRVDPPQHGDPFDLPRFAIVDSWSDG